MFKKNHHSPIFKHLPLTPKRSHFHFHLEFISSQPTQQPTTSLKKNTKTLEGYKDLIDVKRLLCIAHLPSAPYVVLAAAPSVPPTSTAPHAIAPGVAPFPPTAWRPSPTSAGWSTASFRNGKVAGEWWIWKSWHSMFDLLVLDCYLKSSKETQVLSHCKHEHQGLEIATHLYALFFSIISLSLHIYHRIHPWVSHSLSCTFRSSSSRLFRCSRMALVTSSSMALRSRPWRFCTVQNTLQWKIIENLKESFNLILYYPLGN